MANVLSEEKKQQVIALGKLGWSLRRIEQALSVRRETAGAYLKAAGIAVRQPTPASVVSIDSAPRFNSGQLLSTDSGAASVGGQQATAARLPGRAPSASACEAYRELIELGLKRGRNA